MALRTLNCRVWLRYQHQNIHHGDEVILSAISNNPGGTTIGVFQEDDGPLDPAGNPLGEAFLRCIGTLDRNDTERINATARPQLAGAFRPRGGPRIGSRFAPSIQSATVANFSPQYNGHVGQGPHGARPYVLISCVCRT